MRSSMLNHCLILLVVQIACQNNYLLRCFISPLLYSFQVLVMRGWGVAARPRFTIWNLYLIVVRTFQFEDDTLPCGVNIKFYSVVVIGSLLRGYINASVVSLFLIYIPVLLQCYLESQTRCCQKFSFSCFGYWLCSLVASLGVCGLWGVTVGIRA